MALDDSESEGDEEYGDDQQEEGSDMESDLEGKKDAGKIIVSNPSVCMAKCTVVFYSVTHFSDVFFLDLPSDMAWGNRKNLFYDSDYVAASEYIFIAPSIPNSDYL